MLSGLQVIYDSRLNHQSFKVYHRDAVSSAAFELQQNIFLITDRNTFSQYPWDGEGAEDRHKEYHTRDLQYKFAVSVVWRMRGDRHRLVA